MLTKKQVAVFFVWVLILCALVCGGMHVLSAIDSERGFPAYLHTMFEGCRIVDGRFETTHVSPYAVSPIQARNLIDAYFNSSVLAEIPDSFIMVDTGMIVDPAKTAGTIAIFRSKDFVIKNSNAMTVAVQYGNLVGKSGSFDFSVEQLRRLLLNNAFTLLVIFCIQDGIINFFNFMLSLFFMATAGYIFRMDRTERFGYFYKVACFAATPLYIGTALVAISSSRSPWSWHIFAILSIFVMFRGVTAVRRKRLDEAGDA